MLGRGRKTNEEGTSAVKKQFIQRRQKAYHLAFAGTNSRSLSGKIFKIERILPLPLSILTISSYNIERIE
ncbi:hypothetical protein Bbad01_19250 [Bacillus badius]|nr:hypothetical protein B0G66_101160 [Bacillus badius]GLY10709.1 hypothetical protein Bbad01_19250 [Bacillus badius]